MRTMRIFLRNHWEDMLFMAVILALGAFCWYIVPGLIRSFLEILGYPFWVVYTKMFHLQIDQFDSFWGTLGVGIICHAVFGPFKPISLIATTKT